MVGEMTVERTEHCGWCQPQAHLMLAWVLRICLRELGGFLFPLGEDAPSLSQ